MNRVNTVSYSFLQFRLPENTTDDDSKAAFQYYTKTSPIRKPLISTDISLLLFQLQVCPMSAVTEFNLICSDDGF